MRLVFILICGIALVFVAPGVEAGKKKDKKSGNSGAVSKPAQQGKGKAADWNKSKGANKNKWSNSNTWNNSNSFGKSKTWSSGSSKSRSFTDSSGVHTYKYKEKVKTKHYSLSYKYNPTIQNVTFQKNYHISGSDYWKCERYAAFRSYDPEWHDQVWWRKRYNRIVFVSGGWYYWNAGWWYPAWGYAPNAYYAYNGPIYGYNDLPPDQVIANVQATLQQEGYYRGDVDGMLGALTRSSLGSYQRDHGLYVTSAIDRPTLESLGIG
jgi:hypothetical protein